MKLLIIFALLLTGLPVSAGTDCDVDSKSPSFFTLLTGSWQGKAVITPIGPRPYDISFERRETFWIYGQANPGAAIHHWGFYCEEDELWLRFLSTFRGNRDPVMLKAISLEDSEMLFKAIDPEFLTVKVRPDKHQTYFEVLHHGKQHVLIELNRGEFKIQTK